MEGCIESLYEDWAKQEALSIEALSLEKFLMPTFSEISHDGIYLPSVRSYAGTWRFCKLACGQHRMQ